MNFFGIISLVIVLALGAWFVSKNVDSVITENSSDGEYNNVIDSAKDAASQLGTPSPTAKSVTIYDGISVAENTTSVDLSGRGLTGSLKAEVRLLSNLTVLNLSNNKFTGLPAEVGQLSKLETLNLSNNPFTGLPQELGNLKNLKVLDLRGTQYSKQDLEVIKKGLPASTQILID